MEILTKIITFALLAGLIVSPIIILFVLRKLNLRRKFIAYLFLGFISTSILTLTFAWWSNTSIKILLSHYGYDFEGMNDSERFANVAIENMEKVKRLEMSAMGIGWPLKAFMTFVFHSPYILFVYLISYLFKKTKKSKETAVETGRFRMFLIII